MKVEFASDNVHLGKILYALANCPVKPEFRISYTVKDPETAKNELLGKAVSDAKPSRASELLADMVRHDVIEPVSGHGKGKYRFKL